MTHNRLKKIVTSAGLGTFVILVVPESVIHKVIEIISSLFK